MKHRKNNALATLCAVLMGVGAARVSAINDLSLNVDPTSLNVATGDAVIITLDVANLSEPINGVQALIHYDDTLLRLDLITPNATIGGVGWDVVVENDSAGDLTYVVVMNAFGASTAADHSVATLSFTALAPGTTNAIFRADAPPVFTKLTAASDNATILPNKTDSQLINIVLGAMPHITGLEIFYAGQFGDAGDPSLNFLGAGSTATIGNVTYYVHGITGIRVTFDQVVTFATTPEAAFAFDWTTGMGAAFSPVTDAATAISVTAADLVGGTVVTIVLDDDHVERRWLRVTLDSAQILSVGGVALDGELTGNPVVLPSGNGTLGGDAVFFLGNLTADVDGNLRTTLTDMNLVRLDVNPLLMVPIDHVFDVNKDGRVTLADMNETRLEVNPLFMLPLIAP